MKTKKISNSNSIQRATRMWSPLFLGPVVAAFCIGFVWPFVQGIWLSLCRFKLVSDAKFIGFDNYIKAFQDASFTHAFWYTALFAVTSLVIINVLAFIVAYILTQSIRGSNLFRTVFFMPIQKDQAAIPHRRHRLGLHLVHDLRRHPQPLVHLHPDEQQIWILGPDYPDVLAAGGLHDDYLHRRPAKRPR